MKTNLMNVLIGAVVLGVVAYYFFPTVFQGEGFAGEEPQGQKIAGYVMGALFGLFVIGGLIAAFNAGGSK